MQNGEQQEGGREAEKGGREVGGRGRILDAAIEKFAEGGVDGTSLKVIAEAAGVSPALIVHHFGSKQGLRSACDRYAAARIREQKLEAMSQGVQLDPLAALRRSSRNRAIARYLARTLSDGSPEVSALLDDLIEDALEYTERGVETGVIKPSRHPRERVVILVLWSMGLLMLHEQLERLLGVDLLGEPEQLGPYLLPVMEMYSEGVLAEGLYEQARRAFEELDKEDEGA
ncbi:MAG: transcriptional regulator RaaS [Thermoleophilia bacterium]